MESFAEMTATVKDAPTLKNTFSLLPEPKSYWSLKEVIAVLEKKGATVKKVNAKRNTASALTLV